MWEYCHEGCLFGDDVVEPVIDGMNEDGVWMEPSDGDD